MDPRFACRLCDEEMLTEVTYRAHMDLLHPGEPLQKIAACRNTWCNRIFGNFKDFFNHEANCHPEPVAVDDSTSDTIISIDIGPRFTCRLCDEEMLTEVTYRAHMDLLHPGEPLQKIAACRNTWCNRIFGNFKDFFNHEANCHPEPVAVDDSTSDTIISIDIDPRFICHLCDEQIQSEAMYKFHMDFLHPGEPLQNITECKNTWCKRVFVNLTDLFNHESNCQDDVNSNVDSDSSPDFDPIADSDPNSDVDTGDPGEPLLLRPFRCRLCQEELPTVEEYFAHMACMHLGEPDNDYLFQCRAIGCNRIFSDQPSHAYHENTCQGNMAIYQGGRLTAAETNNFTCSRCGELHLTEDSYRMHMRHRHPGEELDDYFTCSFPWCNNIFGNKLGCREHESSCKRGKNDVESDSSEDDEGSNRCNICTVIFPTEHSYRDHRAIVHPDEPLDDIPMDANYSEGDSYLDEVLMYTNPYRFLANYGKLRFHEPLTDIEPWYYEGAPRTNPEDLDILVRENKNKRRTEIYPEMEKMNREMNIHPESKQFIKWRPTDDDLRKLVYEADDIATKQALKEAVNLDQAMESLAESRRSQGLDPLYLTEPLSGSARRRLKIPRTLGAARTTKKPPSTYRSKTYRGVGPDYFDRRRQMVKRAKQNSAETTDIYRPGRIIIPPTSMLIDTFDDIPRKNRIRLLDDMREGKGMSRKERLYETARPYRDHLPLLSPYESPPPMPKSKKP